jgi:hypothetical protein
LARRSSGDENDVPGSLFLAGGGSQEDIHRFPITFLDGSLLLYNTSSTHCWDCLFSLAGSGIECLLNDEAVVEQEGLFPSRQGSC